MGFDIEASHHEVADGQHEIDFKYSDISLVFRSIIMSNGFKKSSNFSSFNIYLWLIYYRYG